MRILKYTLEIGHNSLPLPEGAQLLSVRNQRGVITLWALVDDTQERLYTDIHVLPTGSEVDGSSGEYFGTVQVGEFVWHVFVEVDE